MSKDTNLDQIIEVFTGCVVKVGPYEVKVGDEFKLRTGYRAVLRQALRKHVSRVIQAYYSQF